MTAQGVERYCRELTAATARLADVVSKDLDRPVPTCPEWTLRKLAAHVGRGHLWAAQITESRATEGLAMRDVVGGKMPEEPSRQADWLNSAAASVVTAVEAAGDAPVWTFVGMRPARFWARRRAHEAAVHLADALIAAGQEVDLTPEVAADAVDEWLGLLAADSDALGIWAKAVAGDGETLHVHATDDGLGGTGEWLVTRTRRGVTVAAGHAKADVAVRGPALDLLLVLTGRWALADSAAVVSGDEALLSHWLANSHF